MFSLFSSRKKREKLSHSKSLVAIAMADGKVLKSELTTIAMICKREGLTEDDLQRCQNSPDSIDFTPPKDMGTRLRYLRDLVLVMICGSDIDSNEMHGCKLAAIALGFNPQIVEAMVGDIINDLRNNMQ